MLPLFALPLAQKAGSYVAEGHPPLKIEHCTLAAGCATQDRSVVLDQNWRWVHDVREGSYTNCFDKGVWDKKLCPDVETCKKNCAIEGIASKYYAETYGIQSSESHESLTLQFVMPGNVGSRVYLLEDDETYQLFKLKNREIAFDVDVSTLGCGINGALYLTQMDADGGKAKFAGNEAGAKFGTGYCDAQCPHDQKFINGEPNILDWNYTGGDTGVGKYGICCVEMDLWEANSQATAYTAHPCSTGGYHRCTSDAECGDNGHRFDSVCDKDGCDLQTFRNGVHSFFGPDGSFSVDSSKPFTIVTQFVTHNGRDDGHLTEIRRHYKQDGKTIPTPPMKFGGDGAAYSALSDSYCAAETAAFNESGSYAKRGGMSRMDDALEAGMVLVLSVWDDSAAHMLWLDSTYPNTSTAPGAARGPCPIGSGDPKKIEPGSHAYVTYGNIKYGEIGATDHAFPPQPPAPPPSPPPPAPQWVAHRGFNCYDGHGGTAAVPGDSPALGKSVEECGSLCAQTGGCTAFTMRSNAARGNCWLRASIDLASCDQDRGYTTYGLGNATDATLVVPAPVDEVAASPSAALLEQIRKPRPGFHAPYAAPVQA